MITVPKKAPPGAYQGKESSFQVTAMAEVRRTLPKDSMVWHTPNEGRRNPGTSKALGILAGIPDIMAVLPAMDLADPLFTTWPPGLAIELKVWPNKPTLLQLQRLEHLERLGWAVLLAYSLDEVLEFLKAFDPARIRIRRNLGYIDPANLNK